MDEQSDTEQRNYLKTIQQLADEGPKLKLTANQLKVMSNKYLRGDAPEIWMWRIARNIALAEILSMEDMPRDELFEGVDYKIVRNGVDDKSRTILIHKEGEKYSKRSVNFNRFMANLNKVAMTNPRAAEIVGKAEKEFFNLMYSFKFLPNSPTLMNAGRDLQQLSACYVLPVGDSIEEIYGAVTNMAVVHKSGGGTGFSFSRLRPANDGVKTTRGIASGPLSFMRIFDVSTDVVKQGGTRRGANMGVLHYTHPDIKNFITSKSKGSALFENFNISVGIDARFIKAVENNEEYELLNPRNGEVLGRENAKDIFNLIAKCAWESGDPGFIVLDRINSTNSNPIPDKGMIESTNPCGEQPLLPYESCNLGSINLSKFVSGGTVDWDSLRKTIQDSVHFLDNVIDMNNYPLPEIEDMSKGSRRIGLGIMGLAELLTLLKIPYDSDEGIKKSEEIAAFLEKESFAASVKLAGSRGVFPYFRDSIYDKDGKYFRGVDAHLRNAARTTIAPTGTIAITAGLQGSGIEPFFAIAYKRFQAEAVDAMKAGKEPDEKYIYYECLPLFSNLAEKNNWFGLSEKVLMSKISDNHGSLRGIDEVPKEIQNMFVSAHDVDWRTHINHQKVFQAHIDSAVSKTINLPNSATVDDIKEAYMYAYKNGVKGITVYRDGCKDVQVLNTGQTKKKDVEADKNGNGMQYMNLKDGISSDYYEIPTGYGNLHISIAYDKDRGPFRIFTSIPPIGTELSSLVSTLGVFMSKAFQHGYPPERSIKHLNSAKGDKPLGFGPNRIDSIPHAISVVLRKHLDKTGKLKDAKVGPEGQTMLSTNPEAEKVTATPPSNAEKESRATHCPKCYSPNIAYLSGCSGPTCFDCGYSECS